MLELADTLELAAGVRLDRGRLLDDVRGASFPVNETAQLVLSRTGAPLADVAAALGRRYGLEPERARFDVLRFALSLNRAELANVRRGRPWRRRLAAWIALAVRIAPAGGLPPAVVRRTAVDTTCAWRAARTTSRALVARATGLTVAATALAAPGGLGLAAVALGIGVGLGVVVHEAGHAVLLTGVAAAVVVAGVRVSVLHAPVPARRRRAVAAAGPVAASGLGVLVVVVAWLVGIPELALGACPAAVHAAALTVAAGDGRAACGL